jgi:hypothetical protein
METVWLPPDVAEPEGGTGVQDERRPAMLKSPWIILALLALPLLNACGPAIGAGGAIVADEVYERETGDELF